VKLKWSKLVISNKGVNNENGINKEELKNIINFGAQELFKAENGTFKIQDLDSLLEKGKNKIKKIEKNIASVME
jgi:hypothetical protein